MRVRMAEHLGMCFGVRDAIDMALALARRGPVTILGDLVHNEDVVAHLEAAGAARARSREEVHTSTVLLTAHGTGGDKVRGMHGGADDCVTKPCGNRELAARVEALLRRPRAG